jgi:hypothetical protein
MAKTLRTTSSEALYMLTKMTPILIKLEEERAHHKIEQKLGHRDIEWDCDVEIQNWPHPAEVGTIREVVGNEETSIQVYTDGSKQEHGVGSGAVIYKGSEIIAKLQFKLDNRCSNNQAEQLAILKALKKLEVLNRQSINSLNAELNRICHLPALLGAHPIHHISRIGVNPLSTIIFTDRRISLDSLQNYNHVFYGRD